MGEVYERYFKECLNSEGGLDRVFINYPDNFNFGYDILDEIAKENPNDLALVWCDVFGKEKKITFKQMSDMSNRVANFFISHGVNYGDFVLIILKRNFEYWYVLNALHKIGATAIPATHMLSVLDLQYRIDFAKIKHIIFTMESGVGDRILEAAKNYSNINLFSVRGSVQGSVDVFSNIEQYSPNLERVQTYVKDDMLCYFTSGTSGNPKLVRHCYTYPLAHVITAKYWQKVKKKGLHLTVSDTGWGKAAWGKLYGQWMLRAAVMVYDYDKFVPIDMLKIIEKYRVNTFCAPPTVYRFFMKEVGLSGCNISSLEHVTTAGEPLSPEIINKFKEETGLEIMACFGQTETAVVTFNCCGIHKVGSIGRPSPLYDVVLVNEHGNQVGEGQEGEICIRVQEKYKVGLFTGYYNDSELNSRVLKDGLYHTGDVAICDADGYFWYVGRKDDIIKSSGYRIGPFEVESVLIKHPAVLECGVVGVRDALRGQVIKAIVVLTSSYSPSDELLKELQNFVKARTAPYKYPRIIEFVDELPKTISGKIKRRILRGVEIVKS